jgi:hypothetical protein
MAIDRTHWHMIRQAMVTGKALSAGYPDLLITADDMPKVDAAIGLPVREDSLKVQSLHGWQEPIVDSAKAFQAIGLELTVIDRVALQGSEIIVDLNEHWYQPVAEEYDLVIDPGTSEHCFNIPQALVNLAGAVKVGGVMSQALPMAMFNHGYWNVNPVALLDFYELNGFKVERIVLRHAGGLYEPVDRTRYKGVPDGTVIIITARRMEVRPFSWPQQKIKT